MSSILNQVRDKKVLILGYGVEGKSTFKFLRKTFPGKKLAIADEGNIKRPDKNTKLYQGPDYLERLADYEIIFKTPGISHNKPEIKDALDNGVEFSSLTKLFFELAKGRIVGITGTLGKSTTASMVHYILQRAGYKSVLLGNVGAPSLDSLDNDSKDTIYVYELSSHQLYDLKKSPSIAVFLNIYKEHLDYYRNFDEYFDAKANITNYQVSGDYFIYNSDFESIFKLSEKSRAKSIPCTQFNLDDVVNLRSIKLLGEHNLENVKAAVVVCQTLGLSSGEIKEGVETFNPLGNRLEKLGEKSGVLFVNDSISTVPEATIAALESFPNVYVTLILGGTDRGQEFSALSKFLENRKTDVVIVLGEVQERIVSSLKRVGFKGIIVKLNRSSMKKIVETAFKNTPKGGVVVLSPAAASFDMFDSYKQRGEMFKKEVKSL